MKRRGFVQAMLAGMAALPACKIKDAAPGDEPPADNPAKPQASKIFWVKNIPDLPFSTGNRHRGVDTLQGMLAQNGLDLFQNIRAANTGLLAADDVVLIKVNAQWKYRGCTNSDLVRGVIQMILDRPGGFSGEIVIIENGQGRGSLYCDTIAGYISGGIQANANDPSHSFRYLVDEVFRGQPVSGYLLDRVRGVFIGAGDHTTDGYRVFENVSYPCFTTPFGTRVELREGVWRNGAHQPNLKLINIPVLKHHDWGGSEITGAVKHFYGVLSMSDGGSPDRHYAHLGQHCGKMIAKVRMPVLNIMDAIWVSQGTLTGWPPETTTRINQILASQDPLALDYFAAKHVLYPIDGNERHHPDFAGIAAWMSEAKETINGGGSLFAPGRGVFIERVTANESEMQIIAADSL